MVCVLVVDDNQENRYLLQVLLKGHGYETMAVGNGAEALETARRSPPDLVIADILMPVMDGYRLCREWKADPVLMRIPFVFYTATYTEPEDQEFALGLGAERFIIKPQDPVDLVGIVTEVLQEQRGTAHRGREPAAPRAHEEFLEKHNKALFRKLEKKMTDVERLNRDLSEEIRERRRLEAKLASAEARFHDVLDAAPLPMTFMGMDGEMLYVNREFTHLFGYGSEDLPDRETWFSTAYRDESVRTSMLQTWENAPEMSGWGTAQELIPVETQVRCKDGTVKNVSVLEALPNGIHLTAYKDLTEQQALFSQLIQAQKMECAGHLASGLAHDFNNILTAIEGYGQLLMAALPQEGPSQGYVERILSISNRAERLTRDLFAFSRRQKMEKRPILLNQVIIEAEAILSRLVKNTIELKTDLCREEVTILGDPMQIEQILMNLVKNASDAIEESGTITIGTARVTPGDTGIDHPGGGAGVPHILLTVSDTGHGMDEGTRKIIFEPFFTSKERGKGTGLGLSVVHGIVQQHRGHVLVQSEPGKGSIFQVYLPAMPPGAVAPHPFLSP
jgi:PAS domain S-box-containing protein